MSFPALYTTLAVWGAPGPSPTTVQDAASTADTVSVTLTESSSVLVLTQIVTNDTVSVTLTNTATVTQASQTTILGVGATPVPYYDVPGKAPSLLVPITTADTVSIQWNEDPITSNQITSQDSTVRVTLTEQSQLFNVVFAVDATNVTVSETVALVQVAATPITASDTVTTTLTEVSGLNISLITADTISVSATDTSSLSTSTQSVVTADTVSATLTEASLLSIFSGVLQFQSTDAVTVTIDEVSELEMLVDTRPFAIRITPLRAWIRITPI